MYVVASYQAGLCLWTYGHLSSEGGLRPATEPERTAGSLGTSRMTWSDDCNIQVIIDGPESLESQRWISHCRGTPAISVEDADMGPTGTHAEGQAPGFVSLLAVDQVMREIIRVLKKRFPGNEYFIHIMGNICPLLQAMARHEQC